MSGQNGVSRNIPKMLLLILSVIAAILAGLTTAQLSSSIPLLLVVGGGYIVLLMLRPRKMLLVILLCRASLDAFQEVRLPDPLGMLNISGLLALSMIGACIFFWLSGRISIRRSSSALPYLVFLCVCLVSVWTSPDKSRGTADWFRFASYIGVFLLTTSLIKSDRNTLRALDAIALSAVVPVAVGFCQAITGVGRVRLVGDIWHIRSVFVNPNGYSVYLALLTPLVLLMLISTRSLLRKWLLGILAVSMSISLVLSYARVGWFGFLIAVSVITAVRYRRFATILPIAVALAWLVPTIGERLILLETTSAATNSLITRFQIWREALELFQSSPVVGTGLGSFVAETSFASRSAELQGSVVHNTFLQLLAETGVIGLGTFLWSQIALVVELLRSIKIVKAPQLQPVVLGSLAMLTAILAMGQVDNVLSSPVIQWYVWAVAGLAVVSMRQEWLQLESCRPFVEQQNGGRGNDSVG